MLVHPGSAVIGDLLAQKLKHRGCEGVVIDGLVRDLPAMKEVGLPVFARGVTPATNTTPNRSET